MRLRQFNRDAQEQAAVKASALFKLSLGVSNNATFLLMLDAHDKAKEMQSYRGKVKLAFKQVFDAFKAYENKLRFAGKNRLFHVDDLTPKHRKKYGDINDSQYFEYWQGYGYTAYHKTKPLVTSLQNKYRLSLVNHHHPDADAVAWVLTAQAALNMCVTLWNDAYERSVEDFGLQPSIAINVFSQMSLKDVAERWKRAMTMLVPDYDYELDEVEDRNIELGLRQLIDAWADYETELQSLMDTVDDYSEIFATEGHRKKEKREIGKMIERL